MQYITGREKDNLNLQNVFGPIEGKWLFTEVLISLLRIFRPKRALTAFSAYSHSRRSFPPRFGSLQIELHLKIQPNFRRGSQFGGEVQGRVCRDAALAVDEFVEPGDRPAQSLGESPLGDARGGKEFLQ
jgi:hypothetical protein